mgnify:CR=1 FL=1
MRTLLSLLLVLFSIAAFGQSQSQILYGDRWFISSDGEDTLSLEYNDTIDINSTDSIYIPKLLNGGGSSYWSKNNNYVYNLDDSIGIGTSTPTEKFEVDKKAKFNGYVYLNKRIIWKYDSDINYSFGKNLNDDFVISDSFFSTRLNFSDGNGDITMESGEYFKTDNNSWLLNRNVETGHKRPMYTNTVNDNYGISFPDANGESIGISANDTVKLKVTQDTTHINNYLNATGGTNISGGDETDPVYSADPASNITDAGSGSVITSTERNHFTNTSNPHQSTLQNVTTQGNSTSNYIFTTNNYNTPSSGAGLLLYRAGGGNGAVNAYDFDSGNRIGLDIYGSPINLIDGNVNITDGGLSVNGTGDSYFAGNLSIGKTTAASEALDVNGAIHLGTTSNTNSGTIRWTGTDFEGYDGSSWLSLTSGGSSGASKFIDFTIVDTPTYTVTSEDYLLHVTYVQTGSCTITIPTSEAKEGRILRFKAVENTTDYDITIETEGSETIDGLSAWWGLGGGLISGAVALYSDGTNWWVLSRYEGQTV